MSLFEIMKMRKQRHKERRKRKDKKKWFLKVVVFWWTVLPDFLTETSKNVYKNKVKRGNFSLVIYISPDHFFKTDLISLYDWISFYLSLICAFKITS